MNKKVKSHLGGTQNATQKSVSNDKQKPVKDYFAKNQGRPRALDPRGDVDPFRARHTFPGTYAISVSCRFDRGAGNRTRSPRSPPRGDASVLSLICVASHARRASRDG